MWKLRISLTLIVLITAVFLFPQSVNHKISNVINSQTLSSLSEPVKDRFTDLIHALDANTIENATTSSSSSVRLQIWKLARNVVLENSFWGVGTGDVKSELIEKYKAEGITVASKNNLNAHNQFLQTAIALGIPGLLLLLFNIMMPFFYAIKLKSWVFLLFILLISFNFLTESLLERQAGVIFFAFFSSIFLFTLRKKEVQHELNAPF